MKEWDKFAWELEESTKSLFSCRQNLESFVEEKKDFTGPEDLLYGPEDLGEDFYDMLVELRAYKIEKGDCDVPKSHRDKRLVKVSLR